MPTIFVSHSSMDNNVARVMHEWLKKKGFEAVFLDFHGEDGIQLGSDWEQEILDGVSRCTVVLLIVTENWARSRWCWAELVLARKLGKAIVPVFAPPESPETRTELNHARLQGYSWADSEGEDISALLVTDDRLADKLRDILSMHALRHAWRGEGSPWRGLTSLDADYAGVYFGRDELLDDVKERMQGSKTLMLLFGSSGCGKSSFLKAAILPNLPDTNPWIEVAPFRPGATPVQTLASALSDGNPSSELYEQLLSDDRWEAAFGKRCRELCDERGGNARLLLPVDQLEDLATESEASEARRFLEILRFTAHTRATLRLPVLILATIRSDAIDRLGALPDARAADWVHVSNLDLGDLTKVIDGPAERASIDLAAELRSQLLLDLGSAGGGSSTSVLPLLALALNRSCEKALRARRRKIGLDDYLELSEGKPGAPRLWRVIANTVDAIGWDPEIDGLLRRFFIDHLVGVGLDQNKTHRKMADRRHVPFELERIVDKMIEARVLTSHLMVEGDQLKDGDAVVDEQSLSDHATPRAERIEISHDIVLEAWPDLKEWIEKEREFLTLRDVSMETRFRDWKEAGESPASAEHLLSGSLLRRAIENRDRLKKFAHYIHVSELAANAARRRTRMVQVLVVLVLTICLGAVSIAWRQSAAHNEQLLLESKLRERRLYNATIMDVSQSIEEGTYDDKVNSLLTVKNEQRNWEWGYYLRNEVHPESLFLPHASISLASFIDHGRHIVTYSKAIGRIWHTESGAEVASFQSPALKVHRGSRLIVTSGTMNTEHLDSLNQQTSWCLYDWNTGKPVVNLDPNGSSIEFLEFSTQGKHLVVAYADESLSVYETTGGTKLHTIDGAGALADFGVLMDDSTEILYYLKGDEIARWNVDQAQELPGIPLGPSGDHSWHYISSAYHDTVLLQAGGEIPLDPEVATYFLDFTSSVPGPSRIQQHRVFSGSSGKEQQRIVSKTQLAVSFSEQCDRFIAGGGFYALDDNITRLGDDTTGFIYGLYDFDKETGRVAVSTYPLTAAPSTNTSVTNKPVQIEPVFGASGSVSSLTLPFSQLGGQRPVVKPLTRERIAILGYDDAIPQIEFSCVDYQPLIRRADPEPATGHPQRLQRGFIQPSMEFNVSYSDERTLFLRREQGGARVFDLNRQRQRETVVEDRRECAYWRGAISPDGKLAAVLDNNGCDFDSRFLKVWDLETRQQKHVLPSDALAASGNPALDSKLFFSNSSRYLAYLQDDSFGQGRVVVWDLDTEEVVVNQDLYGNAQWILAAEFSTDSMKLRIPCWTHRVTGGGRGPGALASVDLVSGRVDQIPFYGPKYPHGFSYNDAIALSSGDSRSPMHVLYSWRNDNVESVYSVEVQPGWDFGVPELIVDGAGVSHPFRESATDPVNGHVLLYSEAQALLFRHGKLSDPVALAQWGSVESMFNPVCFSHDGSRLILANQDWQQHVPKSIEIWDTATGMKVSSIDISDLNNHRVLALGFSEDGHSLHVVTDYEIIGLEAAPWVFEPGESEADYAVALSKWQLERYRQSISR